MTAISRRVRAVRHFNRFYTRQIGVLQEGLLASPFSLAELRVLYELAHREAATATELGRELGMDAGYLSRIVAGFRRRGLLTAKASREDGRVMQLSLSAKGNATFAPLSARSDVEVAALLGGLPASQQQELVDAMQRIENLLGGERDAAAKPQSGYVLRERRHGDMGWVVHRHAALYAREYGWDESFEAMVAEIAAAFIRNFDPKYERCWIAEREDEIIGCVFVVRKSKTTAQLRMLLVEPEARGLGLGNRLVDECIRFARQRGYRRLVLWTNDILHAARHIYVKAGFRLIKEERHQSFGHKLVGQTWELEL
jgi:DNA-binding MarR family transcriptional regulator/N-acetylglutamate synthase-like GNAT family acetyltransferase